MLKPGNSSIGSCGGAGASLGFGEGVTNGVDKPAVGIGLAGDSGSKALILLKVASISRDSCVSSICSPNLRLLLLASRRRLASFVPRLLRERRMRVGTRKSLPSLSSGGEAGGVGGGANSSKRLPASCQQCLNMLVLNVHTECLRWEVHAQIEHLAPEIATRSIATERERRLMERLLIVAVA